MSKRRTKAQILQDRQKITKYFLRGYSQYEIAEKVDLSQPTVSRDIVAIQNQWLEEGWVDFDKEKARALASINELERVYYQAWELSKAIKEKTFTEKVGTRMAVSTKAQVTKEKQAGNPRYLQGVQWCIDRRIKLLGLDAPERKEVTGKDGGPIETKDVSDLTHEERVARILAIFDEARARGSGPADNEPAGPSASA